LILSDLINSRPWLISEQDPYLQMTKTKEVLREERELQMMELEQNQSLPLKILLTIVLQTNTKRQASEESSHMDMSKTLIWGILRILNFLIIISY